MNGSRGRLAVAAAAIAAIASVGALAPTAEASQQVTGASWQFVNEDGGFADQAGSHPDFRIDFTVATQPATFDRRVPLETVKSSVVDTPLGFVGDPTAAPFCTERELAPGPEPDTVVCPVDSQVGVLSTNFTEELGSGGTYPLYNMVPPPGQPAQFAANILGVIIKVNPRVRANDYGISAEASNIAEANMYVGFGVTLWGVPSDPSHDALRGQIGNTASTLPPRPFLALPTSCSELPLTTTLGVNSWPVPEVFDTQVLGSDTPTVLQGCERLPFDPSVTVKPESRAADGPSGLAVSVKVPQSEDPGGLASAHLRRAVVTLPEGMSVSPSSASGLGACSPGQIGLGTEAPAACPDSSKVGSVEIETPLLEKPLEGDVFFATQNANPFGSLLAIYIVAEGSGVRVKLPGKIDADPVTGRLTTTFDNTPQLPFSEMRLNFRSGPRAPLATPAECGTYNTHVSLTSWASDDPVELDTPMTIDQGCGPNVFAPVVSGGTKTPFAGAFSPFLLQLDRGDGQDVLSNLSLDLPTGVLAKLKGVPLCGDADATAGTCGGGSKVGSATVGAGPGASPFHLEDQPVYLTGPYKGAPYGLAVVTRVIAGPLDLGTIVVRQALHIDPDDARVTVKSDPLPTIVEGIPLRIRSVDVNVDRPQFTVNPTSCAEKRLAATLGSLHGASSTQTVRFQVGGCRALAFTPKLAMRLSGRGQTKTGGHPALKAVLTQRSGQANIRSAKAVLPRSLALDPRNSTDPKLLCGYEAGLKGICPASSVVGAASLRTPLLGKPLSGPVHLVQGIRFSKTGNRIRTLPTLLIKLDGEVAINLRAKSSTTGAGRLVSTFPDVPDAAASKFTLNIDGGRKGILVVTRRAKSKIDLCRKRQTADMTFRGQNGRRVDFTTRVKTACATKAKQGKSGKAKR